MRSVSVQTIDLFGREEIEDNTQDKKQSVYSKYIDIWAHNSVKKNSVTKIFII